jgi:hypothetical protein
MELLRVFAGADRSLDAEAGEGVACAGTAQVLNWDCADSAQGVLQFGTVRRRVRDIGLSFGRGALEVDAPERRRPMSNTRFLILWLAILAVLGLVAVA